MPYSTRYIISQLARGRPVPQGRPEDELFRALETLSNQDVARAIHMGASPSARGNRGQTALDTVIHALGGRGRARGLLRAALCVEELTRGGRPALPRGRWGSDVLIKAGQVMEPNQQDQGRWLEAWRRVARDPRLWTLPGSDGTTPLEAWRANANASLNAMLDRMEPASSKPRAPGM